MRNTIRLDKMLADSGMGTRKEIRKIISSGAVKIDGVIVRDYSTHVNPLLNVVFIKEKLLEYRKYLYIMLNKPAGVITATEDLRHRTVMDLLDDSYKNFGIFPVGRLDIDAEGLLILTNNGSLAHRLLSPKKHIPKRYIVEYTGILPDNAEEQLSAGIILENGYISLPATIIRKGDNEAEIIVYEGKYHQVKRMFDAMGTKVSYLKRMAMGSLSLDSGLMKGDHRELSEDEIKKLFDEAGFEVSD